MMIRSHLTALAIGIVGLGALGGCSAWDTDRSNSQTSQVSPPAPPMKAELTSGMVRQVQTTLHNQNTYMGNIDGIWGPETQAAVQTYQQLHGLTQTGQIDPATLASLNLPADAGSTGSDTPQQAAAPAKSMPPTK